MENKDKLATQRSQLLETKVEKITKEKTTGRSTGRFSALLTAVRHCCCTYTLAEHSCALRLKELI